jgi:Spy/CpxP family protein refolding chaperone
MKTLRYALLMLALALFAPALLLAQAGGPPPGESGAGHHIPSVDDQLDNLSHKLNLTEAQKPQVKAIMKDQREQMVQVMDNTSASREESRAKMREIHEKYVAKLRGILNAEQKAKFEKMQAEHRQQMGEEHGQGAPPPPQQ